MTSWAGEGSDHIQGPVWVCWAGALAAGRCMHTGVRGRQVGLQARVRVQSPGWVLGGSQPETPSWAHSSDLTRSCGPTAPSSALHPTLSWPGRRLFLCPPQRGPAACWLPPGVSTPAAHTVGPLVASALLRLLPLKNEEAGAMSPWGDVACVPLPGLALEPRE